MKIPPRMSVPRMPANPTSLRYPSYVHILDHGSNWADSGMAAIGRLVPTAAFRHETLFADTQIRL